MAGSQAHSQAAWDVDVLALVDEAQASDLRGQLPGLRLSAGAQSDVFLELLAQHRPRIAVVGAPPATADVIEEVAACRRRRPGLRCVLLNGRRAVIERLNALELGFDAALSNETPVVELGGRVALLARTTGRMRERLPLGDDLELDLARACVFRNGRPIHLRPQEFRLLELLARHPGRVYTRTELMARVWGSGQTGNSRTVDVHVRWIRSKLERDPESPVHLVTVRGIGYRLEPEAAS